MVGSAGRSHQLQLIKDTLELDDLEHLECRGVRRFQALIQQLKSDGDRLVLVMHRNISHHVSGELWALRHQCMIVGVEDGFSVGSVQRALEKSGPAYLERVKAL